MLLLYRPEECETSFDTVLGKIQEYNDSVGFSYDVIVTPASGPDPTRSAPYAMPQLECINFYGVM